MNNKLTMKDIKKLEEELEYRHTVLRAKIAKDKLVAAAFGDRSENAEYKAACHEYRENDKRIQYLMYMLSSAVIIDENEHEGLNVNDRAKVSFSDTGAEEIVKLVTTLEIDPDNMAISIESELGKALLGKEEGDVVKVEAPGGDYTVTINEIL